MDAVARIPGKQDLDRVTVIVEVKGCWHAELETAMRSQLVGQYLAESNCKHGLYLVGWFDCEKWMDESKRKNAHSSRDRESVSAFLERQAEEVSGPFLKVKTFVLDATLR